MASCENNRQEQWTHSGAGPLIRKYHELAKEHGVMDALILTDAELREKNLVAPVKIRLIERLVNKEKLKLDPNDPLAKDVLAFGIKIAHRRINYNHSRRHPARHCRKNAGATGR